MPSATIAFKGHSATAAWPAGTSPDAVNSLLTHVQGQMLSMYGPDGDAAQTMGNALRDGAHNSMLGLGATANALSTAAADTIGPGMLSRGAADVGHFLTSNAPAAPVGYAPSGPRVGNDLRTGDWSALPGDLARGAAESAPDVGAALAVGIPTDGIGAGAYMAARSLGNTADARAANNGRTTPTLGDIAGALPSTVAAGVLGDVGMGGAAADIASPLMRAAAKVGIAGAAGAAGDQAAQLGSSVGTTQGTQDNPWQSLGAGLASGADRAASLAPGLAGAATKAAADNVRSRGIDMTPDAAASVQRVSGDLQATAAASPGLSPKGAAAAVASAYSGRLAGLVRDWRTAGHIDANDAADLRGALSAPQGHLAATLAGMAVPDHEASAFLTAAQDLGTVRALSAPSSGPGPLQSILGTVGKFGGAAGALAHGSPLEALAALGLGESVGGRISSKVGAAADHVLGLNTPPGELQRLAAARVLLKSGVAPSSVVSNLPALDAIRGSYRGAPDPTTGLPPDPVPVNRPVGPGVGPQGSGPPQSPLPPLRIDTPASVSAAVNQDAAAPAAPPAAVVPTSATPSVAPGAGADAATDAAALGIVPQGAATVPTQGAQPLSGSPLAANTQGASAGTVGSPGACLLPGDTWPRATPT